jgi:hypothetical protein
MLEPAPVDAAWTAEMRAAYADAFLEAGLGSNARVMLAVHERANHHHHGGVRRVHRATPSRTRAHDCAAGADPQGTLGEAIECIDRSLLDLWKAAVDDPMLREELAAAINEVDELKRRLAAGGHAPA